MSVGNLPPQASVLIKITYVSELMVEGENVCFNIPGSVAPWKKDAGLDDVTQVDTLKLNACDPFRWQVSLTRYQFFSN